MAELGCWGWTKSRWQLQHGKKSSRNLKIRAGLGYEKFRACTMYLDRLKTFPSQEMEGRDCATLKITRELAMRRRSWLTIMCFDRPKEINLTLMWGVRRWKFSKKNQEYLVRWFGWDRECCQIGDTKQRRYRHEMIFLDHATQNLLCGGLQKADTLFSWEGPLE
jgi:hypothetical protein